jgi:hypothetical protein
LRDLFYGYKPLHLKASEIVADVGYWFILAGILMIFAIPMSSLSIVGMYMLFGMGFGVLSIIYLIGFIGFILNIVAVLKARAMSEITNDGFFSSGPILIVIGNIISVSLIIIIMLMFLIQFMSWGMPQGYIFNGGNLGLQQYPLNVDMMVMPLVYMGFLVLIVGSMTLIGKILLAIAFWRFSDLNKDDLIKIGCLIYIFIDFLGLLLIGFALRSMGNRGKEVAGNESLLSLIKEKLSKEIPEGTPVDLRDMAKQYNVPPYFLIYLVNHWLISKEVEGVLTQYTFIPKKFTSE